MATIKPEFKLAFADWNWGDMDRAYEQWWPLLEKITDAAVKDVVQVIQDQIEEDGVTASLWIDGTIHIGLPITDNENNDLSANVTLATLVDEWFQPTSTNTDQKKQLAGVLRALADKLDPP